MVVVVGLVAFRPGELAGPTFTTPARWSCCDSLGTVRSPQSAGVGSRPASGPVQIPAIASQSARQRPCVAQFSLVMPWALEPTIARICIGLPASQLT